MDDYSDSEDFFPRGSVKLKEGVDIQALVEGKGDTFEINFGSIANDDDDEEPEKDEDAIIELTSVCMGIDLDDDKTTDNIATTPFEKLAKKMTNVTEDGKIKKIIKKEGVGPTPPCNSVVYIRYSSYLEYNDEPTDYAFTKKPYQFRLGNACIYGLNIAVQTMKANEKSWFLIEPQYAFGSMGHPPRIPPNATFLFQIELLRFVDSGPALDYSNIINEAKRKFPAVQVTVKGLLASAKDRFHHNTKLAIRDYNRAVSLLEECNLCNIEEQEEQQKLLFQIYMNLAVCYTKENLPKKACTMCNNIYSMTKNTSLDIPSKVYFHNARALIMLGDYKRASEKLIIAQKIDPNNSKIAEELKIAFTKMNEDKNRQKNFAKAFLSSVDNDVQPTKNLDLDEKPDDFQMEIRNQCKLLIDSTDRYNIKLPYGLTDKEKNIIKEEAQRVGLIYREVDGNTLDSSAVTYHICKS